MKAPRRKQEDRRLEAESKLLEAAVELIAEKGYDRFSLAEVGDRAGFSRGLSTHYFGNKDNLLASVVQQIVRHFIEYAKANSPAKVPGVAHVAELLRAIASRTQSGSAPSRALSLIIGSAFVVPSLAKSIRKLNEVNIDCFAHALKDGIAAGMVRDDIDIYSEAAALNAFHRGCTQHYMIDPRFPIGDVMDNFIDGLEARIGLAPAAKGKAARKAKDSPCANQK